MNRSILVLTLLVVAAAAVSAAPKPKVDPAQAKRYEALAASIDPVNLDRTIRTLSTAYPSRVVGYPGADAAANYVESAFKSAGLENVHEEGFDVTVPMVRQPGTLTVNGRTFPIHPLWPNLVHTSQLPK